jgi:hypothetical protein
MKNVDLARLGSAWLLGLTILCSGTLDGSHLAVAASVDATTDVRRICLQDGISGLGGGDVVRLVADDGSGNLSIQTLTGAAYTIPSLSSAGQPTLCTVTPGPMQVCPADSTHTGSDVPVLSTLSGTVGGTGTSAGTIPRGTPLLLWDDVHDGGGQGASMAFVTIGGQEEFVSGSEVCLAGSYPTPSPVTTALQMQTTWQDSSGQTLSTQADPSTYRERTPAMITRLVVHNTEATFDSTMQLFTSGSAGTSAHVVLDRDGTLYRVVEDQYAAYHAGGSSDAMGNFNDATLGVEVVAYTAAESGGTDASFMTAAQNASLIKLLQAWMAQYNLQLSASTLQNSSSAPGYADLEYAGAALTIHRLTKADRGTDCPLELWADSAAGDDAFFQWRRQNIVNPPPAGDGGTGDGGAGGSSSSGSSSGGSSSGSGSSSGGSSGGSSSGGGSGSSSGSLDGGLPSSSGAGASSGNNATGNPGSGASGPGASGCGCVLAGQSEGAGSLLALALVPLAAAIVRRRRSEG